MKERLSPLRHIKLLHACYMNETKVVSTETYQIATCLLYERKKDCLHWDISNCYILAIWMKERLSPLRHIKLLHACYMIERKIVSTETYQIATCLLYEWKKGCLRWDISNCYMTIWKKERLSPLRHIKLQHASYMNERKIVSAETYQTATCLLYERKKDFLSWDISNCYMLAIWMKERLSPLRHIKLLHACYMNEWKISLLRCIKLLNACYMNERLSPLRHIKLLHAWYIMYMNERLSLLRPNQIAPCLLYEWKKGCLRWDISNCYMTIWKKERLSPLRHISNCYMLAIWMKERLSPLRHIKLLHACHMNER